MFQFTENKVRDVYNIADLKIIFHVQDSLERNYAINHISYDRNEEYFMVIHGKGYYEECDIRNILEKEFYHKMCYDGIMEFQFIPKQGYYVIYGKLFRKKVQPLYDKSEFKSL